MDLAALEGLDRRRILESGSRFGTLRESWRFLEKKTADLDAAENGSLYAELNSEVQDLLARVGDTFTLILYPDLDSYSPMDAMLDKLPQDEVRFADAAILAREVAIRRSITADERARLASTAGLVAANNVALRRRMQVAFSNTASPNLKVTLDRPPDQAVTGSNRFFGRLKREIAGAGVTSAPERVAAEGAAAAAAGMALWN